MEVRGVDRALMTGQLVEDLPACDFPDVRETVRGAGRDARAVGRPAAFQQILQIYLFLFTKKAKKNLY